MEKIVKTFEAKQAGEWWVASTRDVDRQMDIVEPRGLLLDNYQKNNVLLWAHDYTSPHAVIGRAEQVEVTDHEVRILPVWREPASESDPMHIIRSLIDAGLLRALSVGFRPIEATDNAYGGRTFTRAELLEISLVPIPAQQSALREQLAYTVKSLGGGAVVDIAEPVVMPESELVSQGQTPEATAATVAADADEADVSEAEAALAETLANALVRVLELVREMNEDE